MKWLLMHMKGNKRLRKWFLLKYLKKKIQRNHISESKGKEIKVVKNFDDERNYEREWPFAFLIMQWLYVVQQA